MYKKSQVGLILSILAVLIFSACEKREYQSIEELDNENIRAYIEKNKLNVSQYKNTDLYYEVLEPGTGPEISYSKTYPVVFSVKSLDEVYNANDTLGIRNRYIDYFGYFPFGSAYAGISNSPVERTDDLKDVVKDVLQKTNGKIRIIVPSRLTSWGRKGNKDLGIPPNASLDYVISIHEDLDDYEDRVIQNAIQIAGYQVSDFIKTEDDIYYKILNPGTGDEVTADSTIVANYILKNTAGIEMESGKEVKLNLNGGTIVSWAKIVPLIRKGGKIRMLTPSKHAYGAAGSATMPPFLSLDFEIELLEKE